MCYACYDLAGDLVASQRTASYGDEVHLHMSPAAVAHYNTIPENADHTHSNGFGSRYENLMHDIGDRGIHSPLTIYTDGQHGFLGDGRHRLDAAQRMGLDTVPVHVKSTTHQPDFFDPNQVDGTTGEPIYQAPIKLENELGGWLGGEGHHVMRAQDEHVIANSPWGDKYHGDHTPWSPTRTAAWDGTTAELIKHKIPADRNWLDEGSPFREYDDVPATPVDYTQHDDSTSGDWFHVVPQSLKPGTKLVPGGGSGLHDTAPENWGSDGPLGNRRNHVWLAPNIDKALFWQSQFGAGARIHHVKPGAKPQPWNMNGSEGFVAPHAHVLNDVTDWAASLPPREASQSFGVPHTANVPHHEPGYYGPPPRSKAMTPDQARGHVEGLGLSGYDPRDYEFGYISDAVNRHVDDQANEVADGGQAAPLDYGTFLDHVNDAHRRPWATDVPSVYDHPDYQSWTARPDVWTPPAPRTAALSNEDRVSVAEHVMDRSGFIGQHFHVPRATVADAEAQGLHPMELQRHHSAEAEGFVNDVLGEGGWTGGHIRVDPHHWSLREPGSGQAFTDGLNQIGLAGSDTHALSLLHETAHVLTGTDHADGHGPEFQQIAHKLYGDHLGPEAADTFAGIVWPQRG